MENLSDKQEFLDFKIISFILMSFMFELAVREELDVYHSQESKG